MALQSKTRDVQVHGDKLNILFETLYNLPDNSMTPLRKQFGLEEPKTQSALTFFLGHFCRPTTYF